jgi:peptidoglycan LD-endopeptidase LytH
MIRRIVAACGALLAWGSFASISAAEPLVLAWPTPNQAYFEGKPLADFIQPTASGEITSGLFGCTRSGGAQYHEGLDLKPVRRDRGGEPTDDIFAVLDGVVRHVSRNPGESSYGRYLVIEHTGVAPSVFSLYAHLAQMAPGLKVGDRVEKGQVIARMGRSATGYAIPRERAHLHLEIGVWLARDFQRWYDWRKFGSRNEHGVWNGMNLIGIDPLDLYSALRSRRVANLQEYFAALKPAVRVRIATKYIPDFIERYPILLTKPMPVAEEFAGWDVVFNEMGVPFSWTPLGPIEVAGMKTNEVKAEPVDPTAKLARCRSLVFKKPGRYGIGRDLEPTLQLLFGLRREL